MNRIYLFLLLTLFSLTTQAQALVFENYASGFSAPVDITNAGDDRLFVVEQEGRIRIIDETGTVLPTPFLDITDIVRDGGERGLLGLAFHPDYANNGYFFVNYTNNSSDTRVVRYSRDSDDPNLADPDSAFEIIPINQTQNNHNGGCIKFGPDGYLYIAMGDGGGGGDTPNNAQNPDLLLGKMLRLDVDNGTPYSVPADNPFLDNENIRDEIWAIGLRNPWRFSFDRETGDMWIGDVGQNAFEEIDFQPANSTGGENYGWRCYEGDSAFNLNQCTDNYTFPAYVIPQNPGGHCSITGGFVYRGTDNPEMVGKYLCADFCSGAFFFVEPDGDDGWAGQEIGDFNLTITSFGEDVNGELYCANFNGQILKVNYDACAGFSSAVEVTSDACGGDASGSVAITTNGGTPPYTITPLEALDNLLPGDYTVTITDDSGCSVEESFTIADNPLPMPVISADASNLSLTESYTTYQWFLDGVEIPNAAASTYEAVVSGDYSVMVTDSNGCSNTSTAINIMISNVGTVPGLQSLVITPNPFLEEITLSVSVESAIDFQLAVVDNNGKVILQQPFQANGNTAEVLDLSELSTGVYYLRLKTKEGILVRKIVKQ